MGSRTWEQPPETGRRSWLERWRARRNEPATRVEHLGLGLRYRARDPELPSLLRPAFPWLTGTTDEVIAGTYGRPFWSFTHVREPRREPVIVVPITQHLPRLRLLSRHDPAGYSPRHRIKTGAVLFDLDFAVVVPGMPEDAARLYVRALFREELRDFVRNQHVYSWEIAPGYLARRDVIVRRERALGYADPELAPAADGGLAFQLRTKVGPLVALADRLPSAWPPDAKSPGATTFGPWPRA